ncbi:MAG: methionyl-tRNA formyltransferase [Treponema sp.]|nr:methionyl-tRNA formyltransferase [Treponema sp.]
MRIIFAGSPAIAVPCLEEIFNIEGIAAAGVLTNPDTPKGRSGKYLPTDIGAAAEKLQENKKIDFPVLKPEKLDAAAREQVASLKPDLLVSFAYGRIFGPKFLELFPFGGINVHPSLLPKYRGPTPVQAAILNRDTLTGITIQLLAKEMDQGDIIAQEPVHLTGNETSSSLSETVSKKAALMLRDALVKIEKANGQIYSNLWFDTSSKPMVQDHGKASYCGLISRDDGIIDWNRSALEIEAGIRAFDPWPLCRTIHDGRILFILKAAVYLQSVPLKDTPGTVLGIDKQCGILIQTGNGILSVSGLQYEAKKALHWRDFINGARDFQAAGKSKLG